MHVGHSQHSLAAGRDGIKKEALNRLLQYGDRRTVRIARDGINLPSLDHWGAEKWRPGSDMRRKKGRLSV